MRKSPAICGKVGISEVVLNFGGQTKYDGRHFDHVEGREGGGDNFLNKFA